MFGTAAPHLGGLSASEDGATRLTGTETEVMNCPVRRHMRRCGSPRSASRFTQPADGVLHDVVRYFVAAVKLVVGHVVAQGPQPGNQTPAAPFDRQHAV